MIQRGCFFEGYDINDLFGNAHYHAGGTLRDGGMYNRYSARASNQTHLYAAVNMAKRERKDARFSKSID